VGRSALVAQALLEAGEIGRRYRLVFQMGKNAVVRLFAQKRGRDLVGDGFRAIAIRHARDDVVGEPREIFDQYKAQSDRDGPEFADHERRNALIGVEEALEPVNIERAVAVRDDSPGDPVNPGIAGEGAIQQFRQFAIIAWRQILHDLARLFFNNVKIIEKPFTSRGYWLGGVGSLRECAIVLNELTGVPLELSGQGNDPERRRANALRLSEAFGVLLQALRAEKLGPNRQGWHMGMQFDFQKKVRA